MGIKTSEKDGAEKALIGQGHIRIKVIFDSESCPIVCTFFA